MKLSVWSRYQKVEKTENENKKWSSYKKKITSISTIDSKSVCGQWKNENSSAALHKNAENFFLSKEIGDKYDIKKKHNM